MGQLLANAQMAEELHISLTGGRLIRDCDVSIEASIDLNIGDLSFLLASIPFLISHLPICTREMATQQAATLEKLKKAVLEIQIQEAGL